MKMKPHEAMVYLAETMADISTAEYSDIQLHELTELLEDFLEHLMRQSSLSQKALVEAIETWGETRGLVA